MRYSILFFLLLISAIAGKGISNVEQLRWGFFAHKKINFLAVFALPKPLFSFYKQHIAYLSAHAVDPDKRRYAVVGEAECHFLDFDAYTLDSDSINTVLPKYWKDAVLKFGEDSLRKHGIAPYNLQAKIYQLKAAFETCDTDRILKLSADIGHYVGDIHVPLHTTSNYNGQLTNQYGIHGFWESRLPELYYDAYELYLPHVAYENDLSAKIWASLKHSNSLVAKVLSLEDSLTGVFIANKYAQVQRLSTVDRNYSERFSSAYNTALNGMVETQLKSAVQLLAEIWYSTWVNAGQPELVYSGYSLKVSNEDTLDRFGNHD